MPNKTKEAMSAPLHIAAEKQLKIVLAITQIILDVITEAGTKGIPSGHLYAVLMQYMPLDTYNAVIEALINAGKIRQCHFLLTAVKS